MLCSACSAALGSTPLRLLSSAWLCKAVLCYATLRLLRRARLRFAALNYAALDYAQPAVLDSALLRLLC